MTIRELGRMFGLSRATLLYYDRIGLLSPAGRSSAGYRLYDDRSAERLKLIMTYKSSGLTLADIRKLLLKSSLIDPDIIQNRICEIEKERNDLQLKQKALLCLLKETGTNQCEHAIDKQTWIEILEQIGLNESDRNRWHAEFEKRAPEAHYSFLRWLGLSESESTQIIRQINSRMELEADI